ncbi:expressed unknown protein [Seminavis robusta]|uniref:Uncharacterized protein n=1 Tax=Seminavis robusta TaxID=568900 RepID=A0A9N8E738_9STRA|nr:expressed unknown protein [Seminavis robusta]|eukprot:Sro692_g188140.1 n/a (368) ;mRNA; f:41267-42370
MRFMATMCSIQIATPVDVWNEFLASNDFKMAKQLYKASCNLENQSRRKQKLPTKRRFPLLPDNKTCWHKALARACELWTMLRECKRSKPHQPEYTSAYKTNQGDLVMLASNFVDELKENMWSTLSFLMKGTYYVDNDIPLSRLLTEEPNKFLLHAAIASTSSCKAYSSYRFQEPVFLRVLKLHRDQLTVAGPVGNHLPIHIAASNPGRLLQDTITFSDGYTLLVCKTIDGTMLETIVNASPFSAVATRDASGMLPLQLACQNGHSWMYGLEKLAQAASKAVGSACLLLAVTTSVAGRKSFELECTWWHKMTGAEKDGKRVDRIMRQSYVASEDRCYYESRKGQVDSLDSLYCLIRSNPAAFLTAIRS